jgi:drug/metabolite transporter (DMT)-like permease
MPEALALCSALVFGLVHFFSGLLSRRADSFAVALFGQLGGFVLVATAAVPLPETEVATAEVAWGALSGLGTGIGVASLYRGLATGNMSVVVPLSDVGSVALPVLVGVAVLGDRPTPPAWAGVAAAVPALWLVSQTGGSTGSAAGSIDGLAAGAGFALQFVAIAQVDPGAGLWPILAARVLAAATIAALALHSHAHLRLPRSLVLPGCTVGAAGSLAVVLYLMATQHQLLTLATVLAALYPAVPVVLAMLFLRERVATRQVVGLLLAGGAVAAISLGDPRD